MLRMLKIVKDAQDLGRVQKVGEGRGRSFKIVTGCARGKKTLKLVGGHPKHGKHK